MVSSTVEFEDEPPFFDHSYLSFLNTKAAVKGMTPLFDFVVEPATTNNGEKFLSEYFKSQQQRNQEIGQDKNTYLCRCHACMSFLPAAPPSPTAPPSPVFENFEKKCHGDDNPVNKQQQQQFVMTESTTATATMLVTMTQTQPTTFAPVLTSFGDYAMCWQPPPHNCCFPWPPFFCVRRNEYYVRKKQGFQILGRPPKCHPNCPRVL
jgi:hypothetical protein